MRARRQAPQLTDKELAELRRVHKVSPDQIGFTYKPAKRPGSKPKPLPDWVEEWIKK